ncbi:TIGR03985 family CRISPR-associated protein [Phormidium sp. FACHB-1136]|uniref:TIGR03985 family CRISPR-associated protein n=1 Tax=Phormidium sp. FACHB-1136 TaxID=2692848 RepID=UPI0016878A23|nr:TIGR03985 family CRISPR-associated protein [Phormidium sp. FACHB-1136]MBD2426963.1 TIGR03985 family CRISPR-associated protein [Phormidium sp. FACHB-1136]
MIQFRYDSNPRLLQWLSGSSLALRLRRTLRIWVWLRLIYGDGASPLADLPPIFRYGEVRDRVFAPSHPRDDRATVADMQHRCGGSQCLCQTPTDTLLFQHHPLSSAQRDQADWVAEMAALSGLTTEAVAAELRACAFATVHRTLRDDLTWLTKLGWLESAGRGLWRKKAPQDWPTLPEQVAMGYGSSDWSPQEQQQVLGVLEEIAFLRPQLAVVVETLWQQITVQPQPSLPLDRPRRLFVHLDYVLSQEAQDQVDQHQHDLEQLWHSPEGGVVQFDYFSARRQRQTQVTAYPVCLHYARRAKYLTVYGPTPQGNLGWWNYRLDRITSPRLKVLPWGDPAIPEDLKHLRQRGQLPTPTVVEGHLEEAWGFNFYLPKQWLLMRFSPDFARCYVDGTDRHPTFAPVDYGDLPRLMAAHAPTAAHAQLLALVADRSPHDRYYQGWIRVGDTNVTMRLRDWRPQGEVIAPWVVRQQMIAEAEQELRQYRGEDG